MARLMPPKRLCVLLLTRLKRASLRQDNGFHYHTEIYTKAERKHCADMVFESGRPAYHIYFDCDRLLSDYENVRTPVAIKAKGGEEMARFKAWARENKTLWETRREHFYLRLSTEFGIPRHQIEELHIVNSGATRFRNLNLEELETQIDALITQADNYYYRDAKTKKILRNFQKKTYLAYKADSIRYNPTPYQDEEIREFLRDYDENIKKPLRYCLVEYYKGKFNPELAFEGTLLEQLGFKECKACAGRRCSQD